MAANGPRLIVSQTMPDNSSKGPSKLASHERFRLNVLVMLVGKKNIVAVIWQRRRTERRSGGVALVFVALTIYTTLDGLNQRANCSPRYENDDWQ